VPIHAYLIDRLAAEEGTIPDLIRETAEHLPNVTPESLLEQAMPFFEELLRNKVILGFRPE